MNLDIESGQSTRYMQVYDYYKELILTRKLPENTKMPSIRRCSEQLGLSRTTIETAYLCLAQLLHPANLLIFLISAYK